MVIDLGFLTIDLTYLLDVAGASPLAAFWYIFIHGGWLIFIIAFLTGGKWVWLKYRREAYEAKWHWNLLMIDVPRDNEQGPKAVENIFSQLAGAHGAKNLMEKYWKGKMQEFFSMEIASHEGLVRFYIRTTEQFRDLVEAAVYAQYPTAEIMEVDDYTDFAPRHFPDEEYDMWGTNLVLQNKEAYPIRTYPEFEHQLSQEFKDPMAALLEAFSKIGPGEHCWLQLVIEPTSQDWQKEGIKIAKKLIGAKIEEKPGLIEKALGIPSSIVLDAMSNILEFGEDDSEKKREVVSLMQFLSPGERRIVENIQLKIAKIGFLTKFRVVYLAKKEVFHKGRGVSPILGAIKQFTATDLNGFKPLKKVTTKINYFRIKQRLAKRQRKIMHAFRIRSLGRGAHPYILNIEELATLYHFPMLTVKAPLVAKTESKRAEPPISLPVEKLAPERAKKTIKTREEAEEEKSEPPENLPT